MSRRHRHIAPFVLVLGLTGSVASCGIDPEPSASFESTGEVPFDLLGTTPPGTAATPPALGATTTRICLVGSDARYYPVERELMPGYEPEELVEALVAGPTDTERSFGLTTALGDAVSVSSIEVSAGVASVDLDPVLADLPTADQLAAVAQLVCTLTEQPGVGQVRFTIGGRAVDVPRGDGSSTSDPVSRQDYQTLIAPPGV